MKKQYIAIVLAAVLLGAGFLVAAAANKPATVIHVVTVKWKDGTTQTQIDAALQGIEKLAADYPGIRRVWLRSIKVQGTETGATHAFVMEFANEKALADYANSEAQKAWYEVYLPIRDLSRTFDITN